MTLRHRREDVKSVGDFAWLRRWKDGDGWEKSGPAEGARGVLCIAVMLPDERGVVAVLPVEDAPEWLNAGVSWQWNGSRNKPTLTPSVDSSQNGGWHGWIRDGKFEGAGS